MNKLTNIINASIAALVFVAAPLVAGVSTVSADTTLNLSVPINTVVRGDKGSVHELTSRDIDQKYRGMICSVNATAENQHSVHPGNNLVVASSGSSVTLEDVERSGGVLTEANGTLTLGSKVTVSLILGRDRVFSGGMDVNIKCVEPEIEVCRDGEVITIKKSERRDTDVNAPCPVPEIEVCRDGEVITIKETERKDTDTDAPCPVTEIEVCRDGEVITIKEDERKDTDVAAPCPVPEIEVCRDGKVVKIAEDKKMDTDTDAPCEVKGTTTELPNTGAGSIAGLLGATFVGGSAIAQLRMRRNAHKR